ncbi:MAG: hypothetical protein ACERJ1_01725 [Halodesulfovibrio sp.]|uniref:hypothetical protein n=1 Tax=Halodesulfovibrio sp. TaxID=1912772 RepID=UPI00359EE902
MKQRQLGLIVFLLCCVSMAGCSKIFPSVFGDDAMFGKTVQEQREEVYGHIIIDLPTTFTALGTVEVLWSPDVTIPDLTLPQKLETKVYKDGGAYYLTQWTRLGTEKYYFETLKNENTDRWGYKWQLTTFTVPANTDNQEYSQYIKYMKEQGGKLAPAFAVNVYAKRFSGRVIVRVIELTPSKDENTPIPQFSQLYPVVPLQTVDKSEAESTLQAEKTLEVDNTLEAENSLEAENKLISQ